MTVLLGIDAGGTFTDFIVYKNGSFVTHKILSTPDAPQRAILAGIQSLQLNLDDLHIVHGTTVATNALLEGKGARTAFITNQGFKDILRIGRQTRKDLYSLCPQPERELISKQLCFEINGRISAQGDQLEPTTSKDIADLKQQLAKHQVDAVAICMLFSFLDNTSEKAIGEVLKQDYFVTCSSDLLPEQREYERAVVTWLNSYLGPLTEGYLSNLQQILGGKAIHVMQSDATTLPAKSVTQQAVRLLLSGPAGGVMAATTIGKQTGHKRLLTIDMGGTSTDVAMIDGEAKCTTEGHIGEFPLVVPMLDIHTIGAGGGSIARVDQAGGLHVGPESAGAQPGPACYGNGGTEATITDANVVLGRLPSTQKWSSGLQLDADASRTAIENLAGKMNCTMIEAAQGIISMANAHMAQALRVISIHRGHNPSEFCLFPFGGAGGLHMCEVADQLGIKQILMPVHAGILSAQGMLHAPIGQMASQSLCQLWSDFSGQQITQSFGALHTRAARQLKDVDLNVSRSAYYLDLRYRGQSSAISLDWNDTNNIAERFQQAHDKRYGFKLDVADIELVTMRAWVYQDVEQPNMPLINTGEEAEAINYSQVEGIHHQVPVYQRNKFIAQQEINGPAVLLDDSGTIYITESWRGHVDDKGHLHLQKETNCQ